MLSALRRALRQVLRLGVVEEVGTDEAVVGEEVFGEAAAAEEVFKEVAAVEEDVGATFTGSAVEEVTTTEDDPMAEVATTLFAPLVASPQNVIRRFTW